MKKVYMFKNENTGKFLRVRFENKATAHRHFLALPRNPWTHYTMVEVTVSK